MSVERVTGKTMTEALSRARAQLGEDANIVKVNAIAGGVELVCEVPGMPEPEPMPATPSVRPTTLASIARRITRSSRPAPAPEPEPAPAPAPAPASAPAAAASDASEVATLRRQLTALRAALGERMQSPLAERLRVQRAPRAITRLALQAAGSNVGAAAFTRAEHALALHLSARLGERPRAPRRIALVGPTGAGKTTTAGKLAAWAHSAGQRVGLIACDRHRPGADDQLRVIAERIGVPLTVAGDGPTLREALDRFDDRDLVLVDTAGAGPGLPLRIEELRRTLCAAPEVEAQLVLSATTDGDLLEACWRALSPVGLRSVNLTKLDEALALGPLLGTVEAVGLPLAWLGDGPELGDLAPGTPSALVRRVLGVSGTTRVESAELRLARV